MPPRLPRDQLLCTQFNVPGSHAHSPPPPPPPPTSCNRQTTSHMHRTATIILTHMPRGSYYKISRSCEKYSLGLGGGDNLMVKPISSPGSRFPFRFKCAIYLEALEGESLVDLIMYHHSGLLKEA